MHAIFIPLDIPVISKLIDNDYISYYIQRERIQDFSHVTLISLSLRCTRIKSGQKSNQMDAIFTLIITQHRLTLKLINFNKQTRWKLLVALVLARKMLFCMRTLMRNYWPTSKKNMLHSINSAISNLSVWKVTLPHFEKKFKLNMHNKREGGRRGRKRERFSRRECNFVTAEINPLTQRGGHGLSSGRKRFTRSYYSVTIAL